MANKRNTQTYALYKGNEKVYIGSTDDIDRREQEHGDAGKKFTRIEPTSPRLTPDSAKKREAEQLETYRRAHKGKNPRYNKTDDG